MYAAWITLKTLQVYEGCAVMDIMSINEKGEYVPFDATYPEIHVTNFNYTGSLTHPMYRDMTLKLADIWLIGKQYYPVQEGESQTIYVDNSGVNHDNAKKHLLSEDIKYCRRCHSHNVPASRVVSLCDNCLTIVKR